MNCEEHLRTALEELSTDNTNCGVLANKPQFACDRRERLNGEAQR
jgi:hypothetical protein